MDVPRSCDAIRKLLDGQINQLFHRIEHEQLSNTNLDQYE